MNKQWTVIISTAMIALVALGGGAYLLSKRDQSRRAELASLPAIERGRQLMDDLGCASCHQPGSAFRAPILTGLYGKSVKLQNGEVVTADTAYLARAIVDPRADVVEGYQNIMPSYRSRLSDDEVLAIIEVMK